MTDVEAAIAVLGPILPGSIVVIPEDILSTGREPDGTEEWERENRRVFETTMEALKRAAPHGQFAVMTVAPECPPVAVWGLEDLKMAVRGIVSDIVDESNLVGQLGTAPS